MSTYSQCRGQAYDGASNMSGHLNGVAAQIENDVPPVFFLNFLLTALTCAYRQ